LAQDGQNDENSFFSQSLLGWTSELGECQIWTINERFTSGSECGDATWGFPLAWTRRLGNQQIWNVLKNGSNLPKSWQEVQGILSGLQLWGCGSSKINCNRNWPKGVQFDEKDPERSSLGWNRGWAGMNFTQNVPKWWRESSIRLLTWLDLRIIIHKHHCMYKLIKVSSLAWTWGSSDIDCTRRSPNISICWKRIFQNPFLHGVAGMMEIIKYELYLIRVQLFDILEKYPQWPLNGRPCKLGHWLITSSLRATMVQTILKDSLLVGF
jgi:hypothetical protein